MSSHTRAMLTEVRPLYSLWRLGQNVADIPEDFVVAFERVWFDEVAGGGVIVDATAIGGCGAGTENKHRQAGEAVGDQG